jgi:DNA-directed RNA polymerase subunit RPC12/RpoP
MNTDGTHSEWWCIDCGAENPLGENVTPLSCRYCGVVPVGDLEELTTPVNDWECPECRVPVWSREDADSPAPCGGCGGVLFID